MDVSRIRAIWLFILVVVITQGLLSTVCAQTKPGRRNAFTEIKWDDYTFKFLPGNQMAQVLDANGHVIGTILDQGGDLRLLPTVTGADADKLAKSFQAWKDSGGEAALGYKVTKPPSGSAPAASSSAKPGLTVDGVISMVQAGLSDDLIIEKIHRSGQSFDLSADDMVRLKNAKASDAVIKAMMEATPAPATAASPASTAAPQPVSSTAQPAPASSTDAASNNSGKSKSGKGIGSVFQGTSDILHGRSVIDRVGLRNVLPQWDPQKPLSEQFPHVAITVLYAPVGWMDPYVTDASAQGRSIVSHCFQLEAVVWSDAEHSKKVPFEWCSNKDEFLARLGPDYPFSLMPRYREPGYGTGINRTEGPAPPTKMIPDDRATLDMEAKTNPHGVSIDLNRDYTTRFALMFANIRKDLGQTLTSDGDPRVWIVSIKKAAGPSLF